MELEVWILGTQASRRRGESTEKFCHLLRRDQKIWSNFWSDFRFQKKVLKTVERVLDHEDDSKRRDKMSKKDLVFDSDTFHFVDEQK